MLCFVCIVRRGAAGARVWKVLMFCDTDVCVCVSCVHPVAVLNDIFCMTCSLFMLVEDARGHHMEKVYHRYCLMTVL